MPAINNSTAALHEVIVAEPFDRAAAPFFFFDLSRCHGIIVQGRSIRIIYPLYVNGGIDEMRIWPKEEEDGYKRVASGTVRHWSDESNIPRSNRSKRI